MSLSEDFSFASIQADSSPENLLSKNDCIKYRKLKKLHINVKRARDAALQAKSEILKVESMLLNQPQSHKTKQDQRKKRKELNEKKEEILR